MRMIKTSQNGTIFYVIADCNRVHYRSMDKGVAKRELRRLSGLRKARRDAGRAAWLRD